MLVAPGGSVSEVAAGGPSSVWEHVCEADQPVCSLPWTWATSVSPTNSATPGSNGVSRQQTELR